MSRRKGEMDNRSSHSEKPDGNAWWWCKLSTWREGITDSIEMEIGWFGSGPY